jgi:hypothetical protein
MTTLREYTSILTHRDSACAILLVALVLAAGFLYGFNFAG